MKVLFVFATMVLANASLVIADTCANLSDVNSLYRLVVEKKAGDGLRQWANQLHVGDSRHLVVSPSKTLAKLLTDDDHWFY